MTKAKLVQIEKTIQDLSKGFSPLDYYFEHEQEISEKAVKQLEHKYKVKV